MNEAEIQAALADKNDSQIIHELACLMDDYTRQVKQLLQDGKNPHVLLTVKTCALEDMTLRMVLDASFFSRYKTYIEANGLENLPPQIMHVTTRCPIERVAVLIMVRYIETEQAATLH